MTMRWRMRQPYDPKLEVTLEASSTSLNATPIAAIEQFAVAGHRSHFQGTQRSWLLGEPCVLAFCRLAH